MKTAASEEGQCIATSNRPSTLDDWRCKHEAGLQRASTAWDSIAEALHYRVYVDARDDSYFQELPEEAEADGEGETCPVCACCGQSMRACARIWEVMLGCADGGMPRVYLRFHKKKEGAVEVGFGCAMESLLASSKAKYHTDLCIYWAHITKIFSLLKLPEVAKYTGMGGRMKPRQEMELRFPAVYLSTEEALRQMVKDKRSRPSIFTLSYAWHSKEHPDPTCATARRVTEDQAVAESDHARGFLRSSRQMGEKRFAEKRGGRREKREGEKDEEEWMECHFQPQTVPPLSDHVPHYPLVFQDYSSLPQWPRTPEEDFQFSKGLSLLACLYGNASEKVFFLRCTEVPTELEEVTNKTPYHERGWTNFESRVSAVKPTIKIIQCGSLPKSWVQVPLSPPAFERMLNERKNAQSANEEEDEFVVKFTNGKTDRPMVSELYRSFVLDTQVKGETEINMAGTHQIDTREKGEMLGEYFRWIGEQAECEVHHVILRACALNNASLPPVAAGLCALSKLKILTLTQNPFGPPAWASLRPLRDRGV
eukprot:Cvel_28588.t1-p1 / transcript=Cvel_28588.t1 / gene=Cvel_28588 / organism=Chromera_velia_CCMP2878 / gene_product=hypothetical protein / transcript_product=hypothetical protein / location=Cvel_scaffold3769:10391-12002(+) / protein_length=537 / sequence_SO=supercontig / SO=protein_coding / is_pseudo=false